LHKVTVYMKLQLYMYIQQVFWLVISNNN